MTGTIGLVGHGLAAAAFTLLALWQFARAGGDARWRMSGAACATTALWSATCLLSGPLNGVSAAAESLRNLFWLSYVLLLFRNGEGGFRRQTVNGIYALLVAALALTTAIDFAPSLGIDIRDGLGGVLVFVGLGLRILVMAGGVLLLHNLYTATKRETRWTIRGPVLAIGAMWLWDLNLYTVAYLGGRWPMTLIALRGPLVASLAVPLLLASRRTTSTRLKLSRAAAFQSVSLLAVGAYLIFMVLATRAVALIGGSNFRTAQIALVLIMSLAAAVLLPSARVRAWLRVKIAKHFFAHRYDYREEWLRFTGTLGRQDGAANPLEKRVIKAIADIIEAPGGVLLTDDGAGGLHCGARWHWPAIDPPPAVGDAAFVTHLEATGRILELDVLRGGDPADDAERAVLPAWLLDEPNAWIVVPLIHISNLTGVVVVERPRADRALDWEDFDLLKVAGRQVASYLAEARTQEALAEAARFDEFNRRFAFILHDIKNLVSQLSLVARNAERHAENPEFRKDMVATLQSSVGKMNTLLALLSKQNRSEPKAARPLPLLAFLRTVVGERRDSHPIRIEGPEGVSAIADPARLEQALIHVIQNAIDASDHADAPVRIAVADRGGTASITVEDRGRGMSAEFIRTGLFKPFSSTKVNGFGVGAFEARSLIAEMGGSLAVDSREGEGSRFTFVLPAAPAADRAA